MAATRTGAVVLAGGASRRFGRDKLAEPIGAVPLLHRAVAAVTPLVDVVVVVLAPGDERALPNGVARVHDQAAHEGPLAGLATGLAALPSSVERVVVVGGDMPSLAVPVLAALLRSTDEAAVACLADPTGNPRPLPMAIRRAEGLATARTLLATGERRLRTVLDPSSAVLPFALWSVDDPEAVTLVDVDRPADLPDPG
jgi:molybdopterin-guanine dinucleotide biosynthesis protein A